MINESVYDDHLLVSSIYTTEDPWPEESGHSGQLRSILEEMGEAAMLFCLALGKTIKHTCDLTNPKSWAYKWPQ